MSPLAVVLALTPPAPLPPSLPPPPAMAERLACPDIDPGFVHYVAPPKGHGPVWAIEQPPLAPTPPARLDPRRLDFGPATKDRGPLVLPPLRCPRLIPAG